jgi:hypothetical protein
MPGINTSGHPFQCNELTIWAGAHVIVLKIIHACLSVDLHSFKQSFNHFSLGHHAKQPINLELWNMIFIIGTISSRELASEIHDEGSTGMLVSTIWSRTTNSY